MKQRLMLTVGLLIAVPVLWVLKCSGPEPTVGDLRMVPPPGEGAPYLVEALVRNSGPGHGQVAVTFRLVDRKTGHTVEEDRKAQLEPGEASWVSAQIYAPPSEYEPHVEVSYPAR